MRPVFLLLIHGVYGKLVNQQVQRSENMVALVGEVPSGNEGGFRANGDVRSETDR